MDESADALATDSPALAACYGGSVTRRTALGAQAGKRVVKLGADPNTAWVNVQRPRHDHYRGFDLHADVAVAADDRQALERLLRYSARKKTPPAIVPTEARLGRTIPTQNSRTRTPRKQRTLTPNAEAVLLGNG